MDAEYRINGYDTSLVLGIKADGDRTTADSFEKPAGILDAEKYQWAEGILEYDLDSPVVIKPRVPIIKGTMILDSLTAYSTAKTTLRSFLYQPYITLEAVHLGEKMNARIQPDGISWHRVTHLSSGKIAVAVQFIFDEILQSVPYKEFGLFSFDVDVNMDLLSTLSNNSIYNFSLDPSGHLILTL